MSSFVQTGGEPVRDREALIAHLAAGGKPREQWRVGTEHEKFGFRKSDHTPIPYEGGNGIRAILEAMASRFGWEMVREGELPIALRQDGAAITLEPGGQLELSGAPLLTIHQTQAEINLHLDQLGAVCREFDVAFLGIGVQPRWRYEQIPWMPKGRYRFMRAYLATRGERGLDMMTRTATVQANYDFGDEADMVRKFRVAMALQPVATALFANSPFVDGKPQDFLSYRMAIWRDTDPDRCGWLPFVFDQGFGFARYVEWALDVPMFFYHRNGVYQDAGGAPFRLFLDGRLPALPGERPTLADWDLHLSTLFPDVRLKQFLELRGADAGNSAHLCALPALWKGLLYHEPSLDAVWELVAEWTREEREAVHALAPRLGLETPLPGGGVLRELALEVLEHARQGLLAINERNAEGCSEAVYLKPLFQIAESGQTPAEWLLEAYRTRWGERLEPLFREMAVESFYAKCE